MNPLWDRLDALAGRATSGMFGTDTRIEPRVTGRLAIGPDPERIITTVYGILSIEQDDEDVRGQRVQGEFPGTTKLGVAKVTVIVTAAEAAKIGYVPIRGDRVVFPLFSGHKVYAIDKVDPIECGDLLIRLTREKP